MIYFLLIPETDTKGYPRCCFEFGDSRSPLRSVGNDVKRDYYCLATAKYSIFLLAQHILNYIFRALQLLNFPFAQRDMKGFFYIIDQTVNKNLVETQIFDEVGLLYPRRLIDAIVLECLYYRFQFYIVAHFVHYLTVFNRDNRLSSSNLRDISFTLSLRALRLSLRRCVKPSSHFHLPTTGRGSIHLCLLSIAHCLL